MERPGKRGRLGGTPEQALFRQASSSLLPLLYFSDEQPCTSSRTAGADPAVDKAAVVIGS